MKGTECNVRHEPRIRIESIEVDGRRFLTYPIKYEYFYEVRAFREHGLEPVGRLGVASPDALAKQLPAFAANHPDCQLVLMETRRLGSWPAASNGSNHKVREEQTDG